MYGDCEKASIGCLAWLLHYLRTAKLQVGASALIQQNAANPLQHYWIFLVGLFVFLVVFSPQALALSYAFYAFFFLHIALLTAAVSV